MKLFLVACAVCLVAASAAPDDLVKLMDPKSIVQAVADTVTSTEAPVTSTPKYSTAQGSVADRTRLLNNLFKDYNKKVNPDDVKLGFGISLIDFHVCEKRSVLESYIWLRYDWADPRLAWNPEEYGGAEVIRISAHEVWKPDVTLYNSADPVSMVNCWDSNVLIYSSGKLLWVPPCKTVSMCHFDLSVHPYGEQECTLKFGSWTFDGNILDLQLYNNTASIDISDMQNSSGFEVVSTIAERHEKFYPCCPEPYPDITFNMTIKRIPGDELFKKMQ